MSLLLWILLKGGFFLVLTGSGEQAIGACRRGGALFAVDIAACEFSSNSYVVTSKYIHMRTQRDGGQRRWSNVCLVENNPIICMYKVDH